MLDAESGYDRTFEQLASKPAAVTGQDGFASIDENRYDAAEGFDASGNLLDLSITVPSRIRFARTKSIGKFAITRFPGSVLGMLRFRIGTADPGDAKPRKSR